MRVHSPLSKRNKLHAWTLISLTVWRLNPPEEEEEDEHIFFSVSGRAALVNSFAVCVDVKPRKGTALNLYR